MPLNKVDTSGTRFINTIWISKDASEIVTKITIFLPIVIFGLFGNILVIYILVKNPNIRTPTNLLIGNMALADLLSLLIDPWVVLTYDTFQNYQLGRIGCQGESAMECSILITSVISMSAITYDRLTAIVLPKETSLNQRGAKIVMAITWIVGIILSIPLSVYRTYKEREWLDFLEKYCTEKTIVINMYWYVIITILVWLPLTIQVICYASILIKLNKYEKIIQKNFHRHMSYKKRAAKMMFVVIVTFMICRLPFTVLIIYRQQLIKVKQLSSSNDVKNQVNGVYHTLWFTSKLLIFLNAAINPFIYGVNNEKFRRAIKSTKLSKWLFPPRCVKSVTKPNEDQKSSQDSSSNYTVFFIFKRKAKVHEPPTKVIGNTK
ncbi:neuropeptide Y receptor type 2 isoform X3 [Anoplophora glabripennis]|uniref:neuropeptide Y receptor type 2 isoform X3 n=1 Tax=Anoplophora glabripennis TaxID=217634 RepID=UPI00087393CF|nr:neuropeptide Y receptor type 2 isoform X3 [Anoplophora glabripennis]